MGKEPTGAFAAPPSQTPASGGLRRLLEGIASAANVITGALLILLLVVVFGMVVTRDFLKIGAPWLDDLARYLQIWVVYAAAISLTMKGDHITMDALYVRMGPRGRRLVRRVTGVISLFACGFVGYLGLEQSLNMIRLGQRSASGVFPAIIGYASIPIGFGLMFLASLYYLLYHTQSDELGDG